MALKCQQCGKCCQNFSLPPVNRMNNPAAAKKLLEMLGFPLLDYIENTSNVSIGVVIRDSPCVNYNPFTHLCMDYLGRPDFCREFYCNRCEVADGEAQEGSGDIKDAV